MADVSQFPWLSDLAPTPAGRRLMPASSGGQLTRARSSVGSDAAQWAVEVGQEVAERVAGEIPDHIAEGGLDVLRMGTESTVLQLLISLSGNPIDAAATSESLDGVPDFIRRRVSLDLMLRGIQLGHSVIAGDFLAECGRRGEPDSRHEQMRSLSQRMFVFFDDFSTQMASYYREEEGRWMQSEAASRLAIAESLLRAGERATESDSRRLRYDLSRTHVALIVWSSGRTLEADQQALHSAAAELLKNAVTEQKLVLTLNPGLIWAWAVPKGEPEAFSTRLAAASLPASMHATLGAPRRGVVGFRTSHADAVAAFALRSALPGRESVTSYREVDLLSLLLADRERAVRFARAELGGLGASDAQVEELRRTVAAYLETGGSPQTAAAKLMVARNTVTYRVKRAEELLGRPFGERRAHLQAALAILAEIDRVRPF